MKFLLFAIPYFGLKRGYIIITGGNNSWKDDNNGSQYYLISPMAFGDISAILEKYMKHEE